MNQPTILAVDDEPDILIALEDLFEDEYRVLTANRPDEALAFLRGNPDIAVVISDQRMPVMTGDALLAEMRGFHDAQAILLTGYADISAVIAALNRGGIGGYVTKPWDPALLRTTVRNAYERHRLSRDLATERSLLLGLLNNSTDAVSFKNAHGRFVRLNARKSERLGATIAACLGHREDEFLSPEAGETRQQADAAALARIEPSETLTSEGPSGAERWTHITRVPIRSSSGEVAHLATIERDVTEQRLLESRLRQSDKMQALGTLAGGIAHDFNNLLTAILGSLELAGPKIADQPRVKRLIDNATGAAQRGSALTKRLLSFSRSRDVRMRTVDVNALIEGMNDLFARSLGGLVRVETVLDPTAPLACVDSDQLELAVLNLCINSRDAMPQGGTVTIQTARALLENEPELDAGEYLILSVKDEGTGIPPELLARVCEPFFTTKAVGQGTGLGLAMVFGLAQQSGGRLRITSQVGEGTCVELALPRAEQAVESDAPKLARAPSIAGGARILVVDDDEEVRYVTASFLNGFGYIESEAADGPTALAMMKSTRFDLIVADLAMPGMTGVELAAEVSKQFGDVPVLILTGHAEALPIPAHLPVLTKPFESVDLASRIAALLRDGRSGNEKGGSR